MNNKKQENSSVEDAVSAVDMVELKRDMQNAKLTEWLHKNQQQLIASVVVLALVLVGLSLWKEQELNQKNSAALLYMKAVNTTDEAERVALLDAVIKDYATTGYATLAQLQKVKSGDVQSKESSLKLLSNTDAAPELVWQARLDLAELYIAEGKEDEAKQMLEVKLGKQYEQMRYYLLAQVVSDRNEKIKWIEKSLAAPSNDNELVEELKTSLALLRAEK